MGLVRTEITLTKASDISMVDQGFIKKSEIHTTTVTALVDTGAITLVISEALRLQLGLRRESPYSAKLADGSQQDYTLSEAIQIQWQDRTAVCRAVVVPNANNVLLGAIPLEEMDLMICPKRKELVGIHGDKVVLEVN